MTTRAAIFTRVYREDSHERPSTNRQLAACATCCAERGYMVDPAYVSTEVSQARVRTERRVFAALRTAVRMRAGDVVVAVAHTVFSTEMYEYIDFRVEALDHGVGVE